MAGIVSKITKKVTALIILDGWGMAPPWGGNAISLAQTKVFKEIVKKFPNTSLRAFGEAVGLTPGDPGNSEAGHLNIGAGSIVHQDRPIIDAMIENKTFFQNPVIIGAVNHAKKFNSDIHIMGLLSKSGIHSHINHLYALLELIKTQSFSRVYVHLFSDGRDSDPMSGIEMVAEVENEIRRIGVGRIASIVGRFYAMDRDSRWDRIMTAYQLLTEGRGKQYISAGAVFTNSYSRGLTDEFIEPSLIIDKSSNREIVSDNDAVIFFNFRSDRARELTAAFVEPSIPAIGTNRKLLTNLYFATFVIHDEFKKVFQAFEPKQVEWPIAQCWSQSGLRQFHIAETEKYAHVTYFFNGGKEEPYPGEDRLMIPSPKSVNTYDQIPEMSAYAVTAAVIKALDKGIYDNIVLNYANTDMVGHSGNLKATIKAVEVVDECLGRVLEKILTMSGIAFVFADHGNAEQMVNPKTGEPDTEHTSNPVPFIIVSNDAAIQRISLRSDGILASIAPTVMELTGVPFDQNIKEKSLIVRP